MTPTQPPSLDERKLGLEREKFDYEKAKEGRVSFFDKNFGIVITAVIDAATVAVSYFQLQIGKAQIDKVDRAFLFDIASALTERFAKNARDPSIRAG